MTKPKLIHLVFLTLITRFFLPCHAQQTISLRPSKSPERESWRKSMKHHSLPSKGCFVASYPSTEWQETTCTAAPNVPYAPPKKGSKPQTIGNGTDYAGHVTSGLLTSAEGSFPIVTGLTSATNYSLQANSNFFSDPPACAGAANPSICIGWQQFVYSQTAAQLFMQYWLIDYGSCPSGWIAYVDGPDQDCYMNSSAANVPSQTLPSLPGLAVTGQASGGTDTAMLDDAQSDNLYTVTGEDSILDLENYWTDTEFNVFGDCCGNVVNFNSGSSFVVQVTLTNGTANAPVCTAEGFTGETNNLSLSPQPGPVCCPYGGASPFIQFLQSNASGATASCGVSALQPNLTAQPTVSGTKETTITHPVIENEIRVSYTTTLLDSTPGATIYYQILDDCSNTLESGSGSSGTGISYLNTETLNQPCTYGIRATMYATAPGYLQSLGATFF